MVVAGGRDVDQGRVIDQGVRANEIEKGGGDRAREDAGSSGVEGRYLPVQKRRSLERSRLPCTLEIRDLAGLRVRSVVGKTW